MSWIGKLLGVSAKNPERPKDAVGEVSPPAVSSSATDLVPSSVFGLAFSSDGKMLASGHRTGEVRLWSSQPRELVHTFRGHSNGVVSLAFSPDGQKLATGSYDATARIWDVASGGEMGRVNADADNSTMRVRVSFSPDGALLATGGCRQLNVWDAVTLARVRSFADWQDPVAAVKFDPTGKILAAGAEVSGAVAYFDTVSGKQVRRSKGVDSGIVYAMASTPDLRVWACSLNWRGGYWVKLWEPETERELHTFETRHKGDVTWVAIRADGKVVASADLSGNVRCWDIEGGKLLSDIMRPEKMYSVELSPLGSSLAYGGEESAIGFADFP